ncbi:MAG: hypothetical protein H0V25_11490 [Solirubrobacterales bacterium]|nr:hypothetical protein [Solirubrobacterales bacterium]
MPTGCGGHGDPPRHLSEGAELATRLPSDEALNIGIVDLDAIRDQLGLAPGSSPPSGSADDVTFLSEAGPALGFLDSGDVPQPVVESVLEQAHSIASVTGDQAATAVSTSGDPAALEELMRANGLREEDAAFVPEDGAYAIAVANGVVAIAESPGDAASITEKSDGNLPDQLIQIDGQGDVTTLARFGTSCVDSVGTTDALDSAGEVAFFTDAEPDPARIVVTGDPDAVARAVGDSARVRVPAAKEPDGHPAAYQALSRLSVSYDCDR